MLALLMVLTCLLTIPASCQVTLQFSYWGGTHEHKIWQEVISAFEAEHPGIAVENLYVSGEPYDKKMQMMMAAKVAPDVMAWEDKRALPLVPSGCFLDLNQFIEKDADFDKDEIYPVTYRDFTFKGMQWGLPWDFITTCLVYNKTMFSEHGLQELSLDWNDRNWNWDSFIEVGKKLTLDNNGDGQTDQWGYINRYSWSRWRIWVWQNGGLAWDEAATRSLLSSPETLGGLQFYSDITNLHRISPPPNQLGQFGGEFGSFVNSRSAMVIGAGYNLPRYRTDLQFEWDLAPFPNGPAGNASPVIPDGVCISADTKHPKEAWELVKFIVGPVAQQIMADRGYRISPLRSVAGQLSNPDTPQHEEVWLDAIEHGRLTNYTTKWSDLEYDTIGSVMNGILNGEYSPSEGVLSIEDKVNALLREAESGKGETQ